MAVKTWNEKVKFRLIQMPCCQALICWVNPRTPNYCPECGKPVYVKIKTEPHWTQQHCDAWIKFVETKPNATP